MSQSDYIRLQTQSAASVFLRKVRVALTPRSARLVARLASGVRVAGRNRSGWGGRGIYIFREDLEPELRVLPRLLPAGGVFVDVGANVGVYSLSAAAIVGESGTVVSVEPFAQILAQLQENVGMNGFGSIVRLRNFCLSDRTGPVMFWMNYGKPHSFSLTRVGDAAGLSLLSARLDDLMAWEQLTRLDYVKIDAEGAEAAILEGGKTSLERHRPVIQVEDVDRRICRSLSRYAAFCVKGTRNTLLLPEERLEALGKSLGEGWDRVE
ncbi:MAG: FkbM family methyltransferase [Limisphaerales bacterium]